VSTSTAADANQGLSRFHSLDLLATLVAVLRADGACSLPMPRWRTRWACRAARSKALTFLPSLPTRALLQTALAGANDNDFAALRYDASCGGSTQDPCRCM
jgi:two-component system nitrogen regulation sensor histidine kinase GlnL